MYQAAQIVITDDQNVQQARLTDSNAENSVADDLVLATLVLLVEQDTKVDDNELFRQGEESRSEEDPEVHTASRKDRSSQVARNGTKTGEEDDPEPTLAHNVSKAAVVDILALVLVRSGSTPVFESDIVADFSC